MRPFQRQRLMIHVLLLILGLAMMASAPLIYRSWYRFRRFIRSGMGDETENKEATLAIFPASVVALAGLLIVAVNATELILR